MTLKASGNDLSFSEIEAEFGQNGTRSLGGYRLTQSVGSLSNLPLDAGIPTSGQIKFSDFYSKQLNVVIDCHTKGNTEYNLDAYVNRFLNDDYDIVGNYRTKVTKKTWQGGKRVIIHINKTYGSKDAENRNDVAFKTGNYNNNAQALIKHLRDTSEDPVIVLYDKKYDGSDLPDTVKAYVSELLRANKNKTNLATSSGLSCLFIAWLSKMSFLYLGVSQCLICLSVAIEPGMTELVLILYFPNS